MVYRPFRSVGRLGLAACAVSLGVASLSAQTAPSTPAPVGSNPSRVDIFLGYSYFGAHGQVKPANTTAAPLTRPVRSATARSMWGRSAAERFYFNKYVGAEVNVQAHDNGQNDGLFSYTGGVIFRAPLQNFTLFAHGLAGGAYLGGPNNENPATLEHEPYRWGPTLIVGGGMDYAIPYFGGRFGFRLFEADYQYSHVNYGARRLRFPPVACWADAPTCRVWT